MDVRESFHLCMNSNQSAGGGRVCRGRGVHVAGGRKKDVMMRNDMKTVESKR